VESEVVVRVIGAVDPVGVPVKVTVTPAMPGSVAWPVPSLLLSMKIRPLTFTAAGNVTVVVAEALLLVETESLAAVTVTVLVMFPVEVVATVARIVTIADSPGANAGMTTLAVLFAPDETVPAGVEPINEVPETNVTPVGNVSATFTVVAVEGPLFVTVKVYVS
jgi:hypothetical protein